MTASIFTWFFQKTGSFLCHKKSQIAPFTTRNSRVPIVKKSSLKFNRVVDKQDGIFHLQKQTTKLKKSWEINNYDLHNRLVVAALKSVADLEFRK